MATIKLTGPHLGRLHRTQINGEVVTAQLELIRDSQTVELEEGDEFMTFYSKMDPWEAETING